MYDGVHRGHQKLIGATVARARAMRRPSLLLTFDPHPAEVVRPGSHPAISRRWTARPNWSPSSASTPCASCRSRRSSCGSRPRPSPHTVLVEHLHAAPGVIGQNFTYGHKAAGTLDTLVAEGRGSASRWRASRWPTWGRTRGGGRPTISSTYIRACVAAGDMDPAARALGRPHRVDGVVVRGDRRGRDLGYPTANVEDPAVHRHPGRRRLRRAPDQPATRAAGSAASAFPARSRSGAIPPSRQPAGPSRRNVLDYDDDLYGEHVGIEFVQRLRPMAPSPTSTPSSPRWPRTSGTPGTCSAWADARGGCRAAVCNLGPPTSGDRRGVQAGPRDSNRGPHVTRPGGEPWRSRVRSRSRS
jgi:riboflavin kinase/FMN adenylyltransferase